MSKGVCHTIESINGARFRVLEDLDGSCAKLNIVEIPHNAPALLQPIDTCLVVKISEQLRAEVLINSDRTCPPIKSTPPPLDYTWWVFAFVLSVAVILAAWRANEQCSWMGNIASAPWLRLSFFRKRRFAASAALSGIGVFLTYFFSLGVFATLIAAVAAAIFIIMAIPEQS